MGYSIILPTLNENGHIVSLINSIIKNFKNNNHKYEIIIVDDNSTDGTIASIKKSFKKNKKIKVFVRLNKKKSLPESINLGIKKSKNENIIWMDADFQHPPKYIKLFIKYQKKYNLVIFSRFLKRSTRYFEQKKYKKEINENQSVFFNKLCRLVFYKDITDYTSGFICIKKKFFKNYSLKGFYGDYFIDLLIHARSKNYSIKELPFNEKARLSGISKTYPEFSIKYLILLFKYLISLIKIIIKYLVLR